MRNKNDPFQPDNYKEQYTLNKRKYIIFFIILVGITYGIRGMIYGKYIKYQIFDINDNRLDTMEFIIFPYGDSEKTFMIVNKSPFRIKIRLFEVNEYIDVIYSPDRYVYLNENEGKYVTLRAFNIDSERRHVKIRIEGEQSE